MKDFISAFSYYMSTLFYPRINGLPYEETLIDRERELNGTFT